jgi:hypothetical protein
VLLEKLNGVIAVLQYLYTEATAVSGFFLKKKPPGKRLARVHGLENRYKFYNNEQKLKS